MLIDIKKIEESKHIVVITDNLSFANASAVYSYILTRHKKVSLYNTEEIDAKFSFIPWYDKLRKNVPGSCDYQIEATCETKELFNFFKTHEIKINIKIATALYTGILQRYDLFLNDECDGTVFAAASELIECGAAYKIAMEFMANKVSLSTFRLKSIMINSMLLKSNASICEVYISNDDLKKSGASMQDAYFIMKELLHLVNVTKVILIKKDENNKILKEI